MLLRSCENLCTCIVSSGPARWRLLILTLRQPKARHEGGLPGTVLPRDVSFPSEVCPDVDAPGPFRGERNRQFTLLGTGTCGNEALHAELRGIFRQAHNVTTPTFMLKLDLFKLSKQVSFDGARRIPMLRQMNQGPTVSGYF